MSNPILKYVNRERKTKYNPGLWTTFLWTNFTVQSKQCFCSGQTLYSLLPGGRWQPAGELWFCIWGLLWSQGSPVPQSQLWSTLLSPMTGKWSENFSELDAAPYPLAIIWLVPWFKAVVNYTFSSIYNPFSCQQRDYAVSLSKSKDVSQPPGPFLPVPPPVK